MSMGNGRSRRMSSKHGRNAWIAAGDPQITWRADLTPAADRPDALADWLRQILRAGRAQGVYTVHDAPGADYVRERDGELEDVLTERWSSGGPLDLFAFARTGTRSVDGRRLRVGANLSYVAPNGTIVDEEVDDVGALLARLRPADVPAAGSLITPTPPLDAIGVLLAHGGTPGIVQVTLSTFTDIWLPWVPGFMEDDYDPGCPFDNRPLAVRHTPRLNRFLAEARDGTRAIGGNWSVQSAFTCVPAASLDQDGLILLHTG